jgi:predicted RNA binding protein YcfA (HicA-like mRNA interferase family)
MPRLVIKDSELVKILTKHYGFYPISRKGSHLKLFDNRGHMTIISIHNEELKQGTLNAILKQTGLTKEDIIKHF